MAHNLNKDSNGNVRMFAAGELPWHKLGTNVKDAVSWSQAMKLGGLDWTVDERSLFADGDIVIPGFKALTRTELNGQVIPLGIVGADYHVIQNQTAFEWTEALLNYGAKYESAGVLGNGSRIWVLARVEESDFSIGGDQHQTYLLFTTSHDGTLKAVAKLTTTRVVSENIGLILSKEFQLTIKRAALAAPLSGEIKLDGNEETLVVSSSDSEIAFEETVPCRFTSPFLASFNWKYLEPLCGGFEIFVRYADANSPVFFFPGSDDWTYVVSPTKSEVKP